LLFIQIIMILFAIFKMFLISIDNNPYPENTINYILPNHFMNIKNEIFFLVLNKLNLIFIIFFKKVIFLIASLSLFFFNLFMFT